MGAITNASCARAFGRYDCTTASQRRGNMGMIIKMLSVGFPFDDPDDAGMSVFYGPHECTALFVSGITSPIGIKECIALQKAIASVLEESVCPKN